jgi:hypothetical protein
MDDETKSFVHAQVVQNLKEVINKQEYMKY